MWDCCHGSFKLRHEFRFPVTLSVGIPCFGIDRDVRRHFDVNGLVTDTEAEKRKRLPVCYAFVGFEVNARSHICSFYGSTFVLVPKVTTFPKNVPTYPKQIAILLMLFMIEKYPLFRLYSATFIHHSAVLFDLHTLYFEWYTFPRFFPVFLNACTVIMANP